MRWGSACPPEGGFWLPGLAVSFQPRQVNIAFGTGQHFCAGHAFSRALISRLSAAERPVMHVMHVIFRVILGSLDGLSFVTMGACRACWGFAPGLFA
jgi:hypothetical protein